MSTALPGWKPPFSFKVTLGHFPLRSCVATVAGLKNGRSFALDPKADVTAVLLSAWSGRRMITFLSHGMDTQKLKPDPRMEPAPERTDADYAVMVAKATAVFSHRSVRLLSWR